MQFLLAFGLLFMVNVTKIQAQQKVAISSYHDGSTISCYPNPGIKIETNVSSSKKPQIYLFVHPLKTHEWWAQSTFIHDAGNTWHCDAQIGHSPAENNGEKFELVVLVNPKTDSKQKIHPGDKFSELPESDLQSVSFTVTKSN